MRDEKLHAVVARSTFRRQNVQNTACPDTFGSWAVEQVYAVVARSTFPSQQCKKLTVSGHFWKLRYRKSACRCGAKPVSKSKCTKHTRFRPLLEIELLKKCPTLWREAHFQVNMLKTPHARTHFSRLRCRKSARRCGAKHHCQVKSVKNCSDHFLDVQILFCLAGARDCAPCQTWAKRESFVAISTTTTTTIRYTTLNDITQHSNPLHYTTPHYTTLHYATLHYTTPHYITLHYITLHYTALHYTLLHYTLLHYTILYYTTLH